MDRRIGYALRASVAAVGVSAGFMVLATTAQTPDGFVHASLGGPLDFFGSAPADVLAIGDGSNDTSELAALLKGPAPGISARPDSPYRVAFEAGSTPDTSALNVFPADEPAGALTTKQSLEQISKPIVDSEGRVDCSGSVSCNFDPATNVTTVTYPDGVVALVQQVNDMTVVAYKTLTEALPAPIQALMPPAYTPTFTPPGSPAPLPAASVPAVKTPAPQTDAPSLDAPSPDGPSPDATPPSAAELPEISASTLRPRVVVTKPSQDLGPGQKGSTTGPGTIKIPAVKPTSPFDVVKDAIGSVVGAVTGHQAPSKTIRPPTAPTADPSGQDSPGQDSPGQDSAGQDSSDSAGGDQ